jgi:hypothetical protein
MIKQRTYDPAELAGYIVGLCRSRKTRICSQLYHAYAIENRELSLAEGLDVHDVSADNINLADPNSFALIGRADEALWAAIREAVVDWETCDILFLLYKKAAKGNKRAFLQFALAFSYLRRRLDTAPDIGAQRSTVTVLENIDPALLDKLLANGIEKPPLDISYDKHTSLGRARGIDTIEFRKVGAHIENPHELYTSDVLQRLYLISKKE